MNLVQEFWNGRIRPVCPVLSLCDFPVRQRQDTTERQRRGTDERG